MIVIADTSPLNYLILIEAIRVLPELYGTVIVPPAVIKELRDRDAPEGVRTWADNPPEWLTIKTPMAVEDARLSELDDGEREAIALALQLNADIILIDEREARSVAQDCGLVVAGVLRVLASAADNGLLDLGLAFGRLRETSFRADPKLYEALLARNERRGLGPRNPG